MDTSRVGEKERGEREGEDMGDEKVYEGKTGRRRKRRRRTETEIDYSIGVLSLRTTSLYCFTQKKNILVQKVALRRRAQGGGVEGDGTKRVSLGITLIISSLGNMKIFWLSQYISPLKAYSP